MGHALDHICDSFNFVGDGIVDRLHDGRRHSCPAGHCHHRAGDPGYSRTKTSVTIWTLAGEVEVFGKEVVSRSGKILRNLMPVEKVW